MRNSAGLPLEGKTGRQLGAADRFAARLFTGAHRAVLRVGRNRVAGRMGGNQVLVLTTVGRTSGRRRSTPVIAIPDGTDWLVVGSNAGAASHPQWVRNLAVTPEAELRINGRPVPVQAVILSAAQKEQVWPKLIAAYRSYDAYQGKTDRELPVVRLTPS
jgi:F420H(2)-dependent quinone reductase